MLFSRKTMIPAIIAGTLVGTHATLPAAQASGHQEGGTQAVSEMQEAKRDAKEAAKDAKHSAQSMAANNSKKMQRAVKDAWLDGKLETALLFNDELNSFAIDTEVENGVAFLTGSVESDIDRDLAHEIAQSVDGIDSVENKLTVDEESTASARDDQDAEDESFRDAVENATVTARIKSELLVNSNTSGLSIDVNTQSEKVTLSGTVDSDQEKELAEQIAQNAAGERDVQNNLSVERNS